MPLRNQTYQSNKEFRFLLISSFSNKNTPYDLDIKGNISEALGGSHSAAIRNFIHDAGNPHTHSATLQQPGGDWTAADFFPSSGFSAIGPFLLSAFHICLQKSKQPDSLSAALSILIYSPPLLPPHTLLPISYPCSVGTLLCDPSRTSKWFSNLLPPEKGGGMEAATEEKSREFQATSTTSS